MLVQHAHLDTKAQTPGAPQHDCGLGSDARASRLPVITYIRGKAIGLRFFGDKHMHAFRYLAALVALSMVAASTINPLPQRNAQGLLVDSAGHTLYTYDPDGASGKSQCNGPCAALWPPYVTDTEARPNGDFSLTTRVDGELQWVYRAHPLYLYAGDSKPGDREGDGVNGIWHVVH